MPRKQQRIATVLTADEIARLADALTHLGVSPADVESFRSGEHEDPLWDFNNLVVLQSPHSVYSDWKEDAASVLMELGQRLRAFDVRVGFGKAKGHLTAEISHDGQTRYYLLSAKKSRSLPALIFALEAVLPKTVEIYAHQLLEATDMAGHTAQTREAWSEVRALMGPYFDRVFTKHASPLTFDEGTPPKPTRADWKKKFAWGNLSNPRDDDWTRDWWALEQTNWETFVAQGPKPIRSKVSPAFLFSERIRRLQSMGLLPWLKQGDRANLATVLYQISMLAVVGAQWDLFLWKGTMNPRKETTSILAYGYLIWAYFVFDALGAEEEARLVGALLLEPNVASKERLPLHTRQDSWYDLAIYLHTGQRGKALPILADLLDLKDRSGWLDAGAIDRALKCHVVATGEQFVHENDRWCWPAPFYALARRAGALDLLPAENPFLNTPLSRTEVHFDDPLLTFLNAQHEEFNKLDRGQFPGLVGINQAQYDEAVARARKGKKGEVCSCRCEAEYLVRKIPKDTRISGKILCEKCGECFLAWEGPVDYEVEVLIPKF